MRTKFKEKKKKAFREAFLSTIQIKENANRRNVLRRLGSSADSHVNEVGQTILADVIFERY